MNALFEKFKKYTEEKKLTDNKKETCIAAGVSGGADSVCLLLLLKRLSEEEKNKGKLHITAVHVNHNLRGETAERDRDFAESLCKRLDIPCIVYSEDVRALSESEGLSTEEAGRKIRYEKLAETAKMLSEANPLADVRIAVAHHMDDNAETILFNLIRGSNMAGISGMKPRSEVGGFTLIRPLLFAGRSDIEEYLKETGQEYVNDETNEDTDIPRNRIRHEIIPGMKKINAQAVKHIMQAAESVSCAEKFLEQETDAAYEALCKVKKTQDEDDETDDHELSHEQSREQSHELRIPADCLKKTDPLIAERLIYKAIAEIAGSKKDISKVNVTDAEKLIALDTGKSIDLSAGVRAFRENNDIVFEKKDKRQFVFEEIRIPADLESEKETFDLPGGGSIIFEKISVNKANFAELIEKKVYTKVFDYDKITGNLFLGTRRNGDRISLKNGSKSLNRVFIDGKVPRAKRDSILILRDECEILWIIGLRTGEKYKLTEETERAIRVTVCKGS